MSASSKLAELNRCDRAAFTESLGHIFESSPWVASDTWPNRPFSDAAQLHQEMCATMRETSPALQLELVRAHPDLAGRLAQERRLTTASTQEQASAGLDRLSEQELARFQELNARYRDRFGFPFIICARLSDKNGILRAMETRVKHEPGQEFETALSEIEKIAWLRIKDLFGVE